MTIGQTGTREAGLVLFGLLSLSATGLAGAHGAPEVAGVPEGIVKASITDGDTDHIGGKLTFTPLQ